MIMARIKEKNLNLVVYPNDHLPPHVHVLGPGWEIRLSINGKLEVMTITGKPKLQEVAQAIEATAKHTAELNKIWSDLHDGI
jgi:Domain of unknown function (DUF4160)